MPSQTASIHNTLPLSDRPSERTGAELTRPGRSSTVRQKRRPLWLSFVGDTIAIALVIGAINVYLFPGDPCWLNSNPTPLLLLPLLIGGRYGSAAGFAVGLLTAGAIVAVMRQLGTEPAELFASNAMALFSLPIVGLLCGEIHGFFKSKSRSLSDRCQLLEVQYGRASTNLELYADSNHDLQRRLAIHGVRLTSLDSELRRLLSPATDDLYADSLALLNRVTEISEAAIYTFEGAKLKRKALLGSGEELPEEVRPGKLDIVDRAIIEKNMVTCRDLWDDTPQLTSSNLAAIPWLTPHGAITAILVVNRLPFHCVTWQRFAQIETICDWISQYAHLNDETGKPSGEEAFEEFVDLCVATHRRHALPSSIAYFIAKDAEVVTQRELQDAIDPHLRNTDVTSQLRDDGRANLAVLLPMDGLREAEKFSAEVKAALPAEFESRLTQTEERDSAERFLGRLTDDH